MKYRFLKIQLSTKKKVKFFKIKARLEQLFFEVIGYYKVADFLKYN